MRGSLTPTEAPERAGVGGPAPAEPARTSAGGLGHDPVRADPLDLTSGSTVVRRALRWFALLSLVCLVVVLVASLFMGARLAREEALREARLRAQLIADTIVGPLVDEAARRQDPAALDRLSEIVDHRLAEGRLRHVKLWAEDGTVIWSDQDQLVGRTFPLDADVEELFGTDRTTAEISHLEDEENLLERGERELVEVYAGVDDADGAPVVFEAYISTVQMRADQRAITLKLVGVTFAAVIGLQLMLLPLALGLARRVERGEAERGAMVLHALRASELERRRIAQDLHDGVIQDLAGIGYVLPTVEPSLRDGAEGERGRQSLAQVADLLHRDVSALRTMLIDITPPELDGPGALGLAVADLCYSARDAGLQVASDDVEDLPLGAATLTYRVVREGLRNVVKHAPGSRAHVRVRREGQRVRVEVNDTGPGATSEPVGSTHKGLQLLSATLRDVGGRLEFTSTSTGASLHAVFPADLGDRWPWAVPPRALQESPG